MTRSYQQIPAALARRLRLIMTDVDGTLTLDGQDFDPWVVESVSRLQESGVTVGLVSGRDLPRLDKIVSLLGTRGPLIAENGGVATLRPHGALVDLGYRRAPALEAVAKLKAAFPGRITELEDNQNRLVDVTISSGDISPDDLGRLLPGIQVLDSGYMVHLMPEGINKGRTLRSLLAKIAVTPDEVMVFGDSITDMSLFSCFENSVLVYNPRLSDDLRRAVSGAASYESDEPAGKGFCQVADHLVRARIGLPRSPSGPEHA